MYYQGYMTWLDVVHALFTSDPGDGLYQRGVTPRWGRHADCAGEILVTVADLGGAVLPLGEESRKLLERREEQEVCALLCAAEGTGHAMAGAIAAALRRYGLEDHVAIHETHEGGCTLWPLRHYDKRPAGAVGR